MLPQVGSRIKVRASHWSRANQQGVVVDVSDDFEELTAPTERFFVRFDKPGVGLRGRFLFMDEKDMVVVA